MSNRVGIILSLLARYKYLIIIVVGVAFVGFIDDNSFLRFIEYNVQISDLKDQIKEYNDKNDASTARLRELDRNPKAIEKIARERYFMKADDEDIFVLSDDQQDDDDVLDETKMIDETVK
jgi:cell division protein DivIC